MTTARLHNIHRLPVSKTTPLLATFAAHGMLGVAILARENRQPGNASACSDEGMINYSEVARSKLGQRPEFDYSPSIEAMRFRWISFVTE